jgi:hypothetical protein
MALEPERVQLGGEPVRVELTVTGAPPTGGFSVDILFDPAVVAVTGVTLGDWPGSTGRAVQPLGPNPDHPGRATLGALMVGEGAAPEGDGVLAVLMLTGLAEGTTDITLNKATLVGTDRNAPPVMARTRNAVAVVAAVSADAVSTAAAAATALASAPRTGLVPAFVAEVEAEATRDAPALGSVVAPARATFTPSTSGTPPSTTSGASGVDEASAWSGRNLVLVAVLAAATAFVWALARRSSA